MAPATDGGTGCCPHGNPPENCLLCRRRQTSWQELAAEEVGDDEYMVELLNDPLRTQVTYEEIMASLDKVNNMLFGVNNLLQDLVWKLGGKQ